MAQYSMSYTDVTPDETGGGTAADPIKAIVCSATTAVKIVEIYIAGGDITSSVTKLVVNRPTAQGNYAVAQVPEKLHPFSPAAAGPSFWGDPTDRCGTTAGDRPTLADNDLLNLTLNTFAGVVRWVAPPGSEIVALGTGLNGEITFGASRAGTGTVSGHLIFEQI